MRAVPGLIPGTGGDVDQVVRWQAFKAAHPTAEKSVAPPVWTGSVMAGGERVRVSRGSLGGVIDALEKAVAEGGGG